MGQQVVQLTRRKFGETMRRDAWWVPQIGALIVLSSFLAYATWAAFQNAHYEYGPYLSPFYSPLIFGDSPHALFAKAPWFVPAISPALIILPFPAGFRFTCYYYRGTYYKAFWADPPGCAVGEPRNTYLGERRLPLILQNVHRYFLYAALLFLIILGLDAFRGYFFQDAATGAKHFGIGVGSLVLTTNVCLLSGYTLGCHSLRHLVGGYLDQFRGRPTRKKAYDCVSCLNRGHMNWAWASLFWVAFTDIYVRLCSMGIWHDMRIL